MKKIIVSLFFFLLWAPISAQNHYAQFKSVDVQHYIFEIHVNDSTDRIDGNATILIRFLQPGNALELDLKGLDHSTGKGMEVNLVKASAKINSFRHENDKLKITFADVSKQGDTVNIQINYSGIPADGLIISTNKFGDRTFFGDNWPDRAHNWLPCNDHPSDKATLEFIVYAPTHYDVVANGYLAENPSINGSTEITHWKEDVPISIKLMVIGVADFTVGNKEVFNDIPVSSWVFKKDTEKGLDNYKYGTKALAYFSEIIGPYSYEKLAHVQSKTKYGGMENASCIFYSERSATSDQSQERLFAHEVAHQWFGDAVTEQNWHHVWLSEGFATYLTHVYNQHFYGEEIFREGLKNDRERIIRFAKRNLSPIIDTTIIDYTRLLNANSYQKASWFLHMLRQDLGDTLFFKGLQKYYADFRNSTALTKDFQNVMETVSGKDMDSFFQQWLWQPGYPKIKTEWEQDNNKTVTLNISQTQENYLFHFPLEIEFKMENGESAISRFDIDEQVKQFIFKPEEKTTIIKLDPNIKLLFEEVQ